MHIDLINSLKEFLANPDTDNISLAYETISETRKLVANQLSAQLAAEVETAHAKATRTYGRWVGLRCQLEVHANKLLVHSTIPNRIEFLQYEIELASLANRYHEMIIQYADLWESSKVIEKEHYTKMFSCNRRIELMKVKMQNVKRQYYPDLWC